MSGVPMAPRSAAPPRDPEAWLRPVIEKLEADPGITAAGFVGSIGRGDADDWSDVDLVIVVPDDQVGCYAAAKIELIDERLADLLDSLGTSIRLDGTTEMRDLQRCGRERRAGSGGERWVSGSSW